MVETGLISTCGAFSFNWLVFWMLFCCGVSFFVCLVFFGLQFGFGRGFFVFCFRFFSLLFWFVVSWGVVLLVVVGGIFFVFGGFCFGFLWDVGVFLFV